MKAEEVIVYLREELAGAGSIREVRMFGGTGFMLNGNMIAGTFRQGLLLRVGKEFEAKALAQPGTRQMKMGDRLMMGYVYIAPSALARKTVQASLKLALSHVLTLPPKAAKAGQARKRKKAK